MIQVTLMPAPVGQAATIIPVGDVEVVLDTVCPHCNGKGTKCEPCKGKGAIPTPAGRRLLAFWKRHGDIP